MSTVRFRSITLVLILVTLMLSACQPASNGPKIVTSGVWGRPSPMMAKAGAVYVLIENQGNQADRLVGASSAAAKTVEVHESYMDANGTMGMRPVEGGLEIPAGSKVELKPGGYHIMLIDLVNPLEVGSKITVTLKFEKSGEITLEAEIRAQ
jgi:copper(I)-binding protein